MRVLMGKLVVKIKTNILAPSQEKLLVIFWCFLSLALLYFASYVLQNIERNFSVTLFVYKCLGICLLSSFLFILIVFPIWLLKISSWILILLSCFLFFGDLFCYSVFQSTLSEAMFATVIETNFSEIRSFVSLYLTSSRFAIGLCLFLMLLAMFCKFYSFILSHSMQFLRIWPLYIFMCLIGFVGWGYELFLIKTSGWACQYRNHLLFLTPIRDTCYFYNAQMSNIFSKEYVNKYRQIFAKSTSYLSAKNNIENIVLILGESLSRNHMEIYGYSKLTNPLLKKYIRNEQKAENLNEGRLIVFDNVVSPHAQTTLSLRKVLTYLDYENEDRMNEVYKNGNLITVFNLARYATFWISNQMDKNNGLVGTVASFALYSDFVSEFKATFDDVFYDDAVLTGLDNLNKNKKSKNLYVIHLMGSHASYGNRYPRDFDFFDDSIFGGNARTIARYDNSVRYNDYIIDEIFKRFSKTDSIVFYISDHGEELYDLGNFLGHSDDRISRFMVEIPMIIYCSNIFIQKHPEVYKKLIYARKLPYMTDDLIHTILDISGIETPSFDKTRSVINQDFNSNRIRMVGGAHGRDYDRELKK